MMTFRIKHRFILLAIVACVAWTRMAWAGADDLRLGTAGHAFEHLGSYSEQADTAVASGANILYCTGLGGMGYSGLPAEAELQAASKSSKAYLGKAKAKGVRLAIGYVCATSIVKLDSFEKNWSPKFRSQFQSPPKDWLQQDRNGKPLASWYGGDYQPACMNNPDWRVYEKCMVRLQLEAGHDGIFFDNPTVHPEGCYCKFCMAKFGEFSRNGKSAGVEVGSSTEDLRRLALSHPREFMMFRCTTARDFLAEMRKYARSIKRDALITCNNSLNSPDVFYSQCRNYGYNIHEMSKKEDYVVVEDMASQPRMLANGALVEYAPTYKLLHAISHGKPVVAVTIADGDYCTAPNLMRLAMAEAAANGASYLSWPTRPENQRQRMSAGIRQEADFLRRNEKLLNGVKPRRDVMLFLPFRQWLDTNSCAVSGVAGLLCRSNIQFGVFCEDDFKEVVKASSTSSKNPVIVAESASVWNETERALVEKFQKAGGRIIFADKSDWWGELQKVLVQPSVVLAAPAFVRVLVQDQSTRSIVHLYNLNTQKVSSFEDKVQPVADVKLSVRVPFKKVNRVRALTADGAGTDVALPFKVRTEGAASFVEVVVPKLEIATILCVEK
ncbi:hypothetical protein [Pedosphaera parvula]|uniref:Beta-galactosidase trimerisation domain-containing protein n=1 Tax=Pedosphaera parvula (strain Ellin514) TaxID=320771 RepID=B9XMA0_PEDPL|nr:hypothetical protein [Pedosphaera parvula]EEF59093.1 hypothetical protein Cflav_PD2221 [Pedosphaera parvula Ellin514]